MPPLRGRARGAALSLMALAGILLRLDFDASYLQARIEGEEPLPVADPLSGGVRAGDLAVLPEVGFGTGEATLPPAFEVGASAATGGDAAAHEVAAPALGYEAEAGEAAVEAPVGEDTAAEDTAADET